MSSEGSVARFDADAAAHGLQVTVVERPPADSLADAAAALGIAESDIVKTLVVQRHDGGFLLALVPGGRSIAWKKLRAVVGVNKLHLPDAATALEATGYERGTITPIGANGGHPVYADQCIVGRRIALGAGRHGATVFVDADAVIAAYGATVADISDAETPRD